MSGEPLSAISKATEARRRMAKNGWRPVPIRGVKEPCESPGKMPAMKDWRNACVDPEEADFQLWAKRYPRATNTGFLCDRLRVLDIDVEDPARAIELRELAERTFGKTMIRTRTNSSRFALVYRAQEGNPPKITLPGEHGKLEVLGNGQQLVAFGNHPSGATLAWPLDGPDTVQRKDLPAVSEDDLAAFLIDAATIIGALPLSPGAAPGHAQTSDMGLVAENMDEVERAVAAIPNDGPADWEAFNHMGMAIFGATAGDDIGNTMFHAWASKHPSYDFAETENRWQHYATSPPTKIGVGWIFHHAAQHGFSRSPALTDDDVDKTFEMVASEPTLDGLPLHEDGIARAFAKRFGNQLRYDCEAGRWYVWEGTYWRPDPTRLPFDWARRIGRKLASKAGVAKTDRLRVARASTAEAVEKYARADRAFVVTSDEWDKDEMLLGTPGGTVNLSTGTLHEANQADRITKRAAVAPTAAAGFDEYLDCPRWMQFLWEATAGNLGLIRFLQQWCGYCLTGDTREHALLFVYGPGGNGKSVWLNTIAAILGDYAVTASMDTFMASRTDRHPADMAMLRGARLVTASETEEGRAWAEVRVKQLTGGDKVSARFMRQDFFTFVPQFKLTIVGNNKPVLHNVDDAARRRFNVVPFEHVPATPDRELEAKLRSEWPAILRWMIDGCLDWQRNGLLRPKIVVDTTAEYFMQQDVMALWLEDCCERGDNHTETNARLWDSWNQYAAQRGEQPGSRNKTFPDKLKHRGFTAIRDELGIRGRGFKGLRVRDDADWMV